MQKEITLNEAEVINSYLLKNWETVSKDLHLSNKNLYNLIALKKEFEGLHRIIQETVATIMKSHGATENENGMLRVDDDKISIVNKELIDLSEKTEVIEYQPIKIREEDSIPSSLLEIFYDFIEIE